MKKTTLFLAALIFSTTVGANEACNQLIKQAEAYREQTHFFFDSANYRTASTFVKMGAIYSMQAKAVCKGTQLQKAKELIKFAYEARLAIKNIKQ